MGKNPINTGIHRITAPHPMAIAFIAVALTAATAAPSAFEMVGFASQNGGTTGGEGGRTVTATTFSQLKAHAESSERLIIKVEGTISNGGGGTISINSNKSVIGVGSTAFLKGLGFSITSKNIIIRNLKMTLVGVNNPGGVNGGDVLSIVGPAQNIWVDHCEMYAEDPDVQMDIDKYDGLIDVKGNAGFITFSWNYFHDHHKCGIVGASESDIHGERKITFHHNYYQKVKLRVPHYRGGTGHFFNNYVVGAKDASEIRNGACVRVERNYYEPLHYSIYTPNDYPGSVEMIENIEIERNPRPYPPSCVADIPDDYAAVLTRNTEAVKVIVPTYAGVGKLDSDITLVTKDGQPGGIGAEPGGYGAGIDYKLRIFNLNGRSVHANSFTALRTVLKSCH